MNAKMATSVINNNMPRLAHPLRFKQLTLLILHEGQNVLLGMKKRGSEWSLIDFLYILVWPIIILWQSFHPTLWNYVFMHHCLQKQIWWGKVEWFRWQGRKQRQEHPWSSTEGNERRGRCHTHRFFSGFDIPFPSSLFVTHYIFFSSS